MEKITVFVDNLHKSICYQDLRRLVSCRDSIKRIYISHKRRNFCPYSFAFIDFDDLRGALEAIRSLNGIMFKGRRLIAQPARVWSFQDAGKRIFRDKPLQTLFRRSRRSNNNKSCDPAQHSDEVNNSLSTNSMLVIQADKNVEEKLLRSVTVEWRNGMYASDLGAKALSCFGGCNGAIILSSRRCIVLFNSDSDRDAALRKGRLLQDVKEIREWNRNDQPLCRTARVAIRGLPLHAWNVKNFSILAGTVGDVVKVEEDDDSIPLFSEVTAIVETRMSNPLCKTIRTVIDGQVFNVTIREVLVDKENEDLGELKLDCENQLLVTPSLELGVGDSFVQDKVQDKPDEDEDESFVKETNLVNLADSEETVRANDVCDSLNGGMEVAPSENEADKDNFVDIEKAKDSVDDLIGSDVVYTVPEQSPIKSTPIGRKWKISVGSESVVGTIIDTSTFNVSPPLSSPALLFNSPPNDGNDIVNSDDGARDSRGRIIDSFKEAKAIVRMAEDYNCPIVDKEMAITQLERIVRPLSVTQDA